MAIATRRLLSSGTGGGFPARVPFTPSSTLTPTKSGSNPTLNIAGSAPENIVKVGSTYYMLYTHRPGASSTTWDVRMAHASSPNPTSWTDDGSILTAGSQSWEGTGTPGIIGACLLEDAGTFYIFYGADQDLATGVTAGIGYATASTVTGPYTKYASNPILSPGTSGAWDDLRCHEPSVLHVGDTWVMAYMGDTPTEGQHEKIGIATASSPSGPWTKAAGNPIIGFGSGWDAGGAADPSLSWDGVRWWIWYSGLNTAGAKPWKLGLAYAPTPTGTWTRFAGNPVISTGTSLAFDNQAAWRGALFIENGGIYVAYGGIPSSGNSADAKGGNATIAVS